MPPLRNGVTPVSGMICYPYVRKDNRGGEILRPAGWGEKKGTSLEPLLNLKDRIDEIELEAWHDPVELPAEPLFGERPFVPLSRDLHPVSFP